MIDVRKPVWSDGLHGWSEDRVEGMTLRGICYNGDDPEPQPTEQKVINSSLPEYAQPYYERLMARGEAESNQPYTAYDGPRVAQFSDDTSAGFDSVRGTAGSGLGALNSAMGHTRGAMNSTFNGAAAQQYMNPFIQNVIGSTMNRMNQNFAEQQGARDAQAVQAGAFGGSRAAISTMQAQRDNNEQINRMISEQLHSGYTNAQSQFNTDRSAGMDAAKSLATMQGQQRELAYQDADKLMGIGGAQEAKTQQGYDSAYADFVNQRDYEKNQLAFYGGLLHGVPVQPNSDTTTYQAEPSTTQQLMGLGIGGLGAYKALSK
jgi:hypothetical protein